MQDDIEFESEQDPEYMNPGVPTDLLELHIHLEETGVSLEEFKEMFGA